MGGSTVPFKSDSVIPFRRHPERRAGLAGFDIRFQYDRAFVTDFKLQDDMNARSTILGSKRHASDASYPLSAAA
mgnify:CR=1 FL=1